MIFCLIGGKVEYNREETTFSPYLKPYEAFVNECPAKGSLRHTVPLGTDIFGNFQRLDNCLESLPDRLHVTNEYLESTRQQLEEAKAAVDKPFPLETDFTTKSVRLAELNAILNLDTPENEIVDGERGEGDSAPAPEQNLVRYCPIR